jgi:hypothetical protein
MNWSAIGAIFLALAVGLGAFGAHALKDRLDAYSLGVWEKAVFYHFVHALGLLVVSMLPRTGTFPLNGASSVCWLLRRRADLLGQFVRCADGRAVDGRDYADRRALLHRGVPLLAYYFIARG